MCYIQLNVPFVTFSYQRVGVNQHLMFLCVNFLCYKQPQNSSKKSFWKQKIAIVFLSVNTSSGARIRAPV